MAQEREEDATAASALFADTQHACSHKEGARSLSPVRATCEHSSDFASDTPAARRPGLDGDKHSTCQTQQLRVMLDDPWTAWYLLGTSILAVATQICLRIVQEEGKPQSAAAAGSLNAQHSVSVAELGTQEEVVNDVKNDSPASLHACEAFDEECHARMLAFAEAASYHQNTSRFYSELKDYVLHAIFIFSLYAFSYAGLRRYQRFRRIRGSSRAAPPRRTSEEVAALLEDDAVPFALCSLAVSVALGSMLLVPLTVLDGLLRTYLSSEELYGGLASTDLSFIWQLLAVVSTACHFVLLPFAFFYTESEGLGRSAIGQRRFFSRMRETTVTLALVLALVSLLVKVLEFMQVPYMQLERLALSYIATSMLGSLIFLILVPFGFERYITLAILALQQALAASQDKVRCDTEQEADEADDADQFESESRTWAIWRLKKMHEAEGAAGTGASSIPPPQGGVRGETNTGGNSPAHRRAARRARQQASRLYTLGKVFGGLGLVLLSIALPGDRAAPRRGLPGVRRAVAAAPLHRALGKRCARIGARHTLRVLGLCAGDVRVEGHVARARLAAVPVDMVPETECARAHRARAVPALPRVPGGRHKLPGHHLHARPHQDPARPRGVGDSGLPAPQDALELQLPLHGCEHPGAGRRRQTPPAPHARHTPHAAGAPPDLPLHRPRPGERLAPRARHWRSLCPAPPHKAACTACASVQV